MLLSEYIQKLQEFLKENGDMECFYSKDPEGNGFYKVSYAGSLFRTNDPEGYSPDLVQEESLEDYVDEEEFEDYKKVVVIN